MPVTTTEIITDLKSARERSGLSQRALSAKTGLDQAHISKIETGKTDVTLATLIEIARALDVELMLVPRKFIPAVKTITREEDDASPAPRPAYQLDDEDDDENN